MKKEEIIEMSRYALSETIVPECVGCDHVFDYTGPSSMIVEEKCRVYIKPAVKWQQKPVAMKEALVYSKESPKGAKEMIPVKIFRCPMATHYKSEETKAAEKVRAGQQKQKKKSRR